MLPALPALTSAGSLVVHGELQSPDVIVPRPGVSIHSSVPGSAFSATISGEVSQVGQFRKRWRIAPANSDALMTIVALSPLVAQVPIASRFAKVVVNFASHSIDGFVVLLSLAFSKQRCNFPSAFSLADWHALLRGARETDASW